jgi:metal-responsive CopG/Arc/MetJ family transcriptional regulator
VQSPDMQRPIADIVKRVSVWMPPDLMRQIDDYRYARRIPSRAEALRRLIEAGLLEPGDKPACPST